MKGRISAVFWGISLLVFAMSCGNSQAEGDLLPEALIDSTKTYAPAPYVFPRLSTAAQAQTSQWSVYAEFEQNATTLNGKTIEQLQDRTERMITFADSLSKQLPDSLYTPGIFSRLVVVKTRLGMLHQEVRRIPPDSLRIEANLEEMNIAMRNMMIQINEKFEKDAINEQRREDEEKELEKQKRFLDSVREAELQDQQRSQ